MYSLSIRCLVVIKINVIKSDYFICLVPSIIFSISILICKCKPEIFLKLAASTPPGQPNAYLFTVIVNMGHCTEQRWKILLK